MTEKTETTEQTAQPANPVKPAAKPPRALWRRWYSLLVMAAVVLALLVVFVLPMGAKYYLTDWLLNNGADKAHIDKLGWNPFMGEVWLDGVDLQQEGKTLLSQADLELKISLPALFGKDIFLTRATYSDLNLVVVRGDDGSIKIGTVKVGPNGEEEQVAPPVTVKEADGASSPWAFLANDVTLKNCKVHYISPLLNLHVEVEELALDAFSTREGAAPGTLKLKGKVEGEPISLDLTALQVLPQLKVAGKVEVAGFNLDELDTILKDALPTFDGIASLAGTVDFEMKEGLLQVEYDGGLKVKKADIGSDAFRTGADLLTYDGKAYFAMPDGAPMEVKTDGKLLADTYNLAVPAADLKETEQQIVLDGKTTVSIGDGVVVDFGGDLDLKAVGLVMPMLETGSTTLNYKGKVHYDLAKANLVNTDGTLQLDGLHYAMDELAMDVSEEQFLWTGKIDYQGLRKGEANVVNTDGALTLQPLDFSFGRESDKLAAALNKLGWKGKFTFAMPDSGSRIALDGVLDGDTVSFAQGAQGEALAAGLQSLGWDGSVTFATPESGSHVAVDGKLNSSGINFAMPSAGVKVTEKSLTVSSKTDATFGASTDLNSTSSIDGAELALHLNGAEQPMVTLDALKLTDFQGLGGKKLKAKQLSAQGLTADIAGEMPLQVTVPAINLNAFSTDDLQNFAMETLAIDQPKIMATHNSAEMLDLHDITFTGLAAATDGSASVDRLSLNKLVFLRDKKGSIRGAGASLGEARLTGIKWSEKGGFSGKKLNFKNLVSTIIRDKKGGISIADNLAAMSAAPKAVPAEAGDKPAAETAKVAKAAKKEKKAKVKKGQAIALPFPVSLGEVAISGNSGVNFTDYTLAVPFKTDLQIQKFTIGELDSTKASAKTPVHFLGLLEKRAPFKFNGTVSPFLVEPWVDMMIKLKNFPLQDVTAYAIQAVGTGLASGQLQVTTSVKLAENYLKMDNNVVLANLETRVISKELAAELDNQLPVPLSTVLSLLKNKDGNIDLDVPLHGAPDKLHVGLTDVIITALSKAVIPALSGYAVYALGPYGALAYAGMKLGEEMLKEGDTPVIFVKGAKNLIPEQEKGLAAAGEKIAKGKDDWQICPYVASWEFMGNAEVDAAAGKTIAAPAKDVRRLDMLGQIRASNVQHWLMQKYGIDEDRLLLCTTTIKTEKKMLPVVVIQKQ